MSRGNGVDILNSRDYTGDMHEPLEAPDQYISIARAAQLAGLSPVTLRIQVQRGKLHTVKLARDLLTTRRWLHDYLVNRDDSRGAQPLPLPPEYVAPE